MIWDFYGTGRDRDVDFIEREEYTENNGFFVPILINEILGTRKRVECRIFEYGIYTKFQKE